MYLSCWLLSCSFMSQSFSFSFLFDVSFNFVTLDLFQFSILFLGVPNTPELSKDSKLDFGSFNLNVLCLGLKGLLV